MAVQRARWTGVIEFPDLGLAISGWLYASRKRASPPWPVVQIHTTCRTRLPTKISERQEGIEDLVSELGGEKVGAPTTRVAEQSYCPTCSRALRTDEVGHAVDVEGSLVLISAEEYQGLKGEPTKTVRAQLVRGAPSLLETIGTGRRFTLIPKLESVKAYYQLFEILRIASRQGFLSELVVDRRSLVAVVRPLLTDASVFGRSRRLLDVVELADVETVVNPADSGLLPADEPYVDPQEIAAEIAAATRVEVVLQSAQTRSPERERLRTLVEAKRQRPARPPKKMAPSVHPAKRQKKQELA